jgi:hypothetical protein
MSTERVKHGQTFSLAGTSGANGTLVGLTGNPGALIEVTGFAVNNGDIQLYGARAPHKHGATLNDTGTFTNAGALTVGGAENSAHAALLGIEGTLTNTGVIVAGAGVYGAGGQIDIAAGGLMRSSGTITLAAGLKGGSEGATLIDSGRLVNEARGVIDVVGVSGANLFSYAGSGGSLVVSGGFENIGTLNIYSAFRTTGPSPAGTVAAAGVLQNSGNIFVGDANPSFYTSGGALLSVSGTLANSGTVSVAGGPFGQFRGGGEASGTLAITGTLINQGQITLQSGGGGYYRGQGGLLVDSGIVENSGTLTIEGEAGGGMLFDPYSFNGGTLVVDGELTNTGAMLEQQNGAIQVTGSLTNDATLTAFGGESLLKFSVYQGYGGLISVAGTLTNASGAIISLHGGLSEKYGPNHYISPWTGGGALLAVTGVMTNDGMVVVGGGAGGYPLRYNHDFGYGAALSVALGGILTNYGTVEIQQGETSSYGLYGTGGLATDAGQFANEGVITIAGGVGTSVGEFVITQTGELTAGTINGAGVLLNQGVIGAGGGLSVISSVTFLNDGKVKSYGASSRLTINSAVSSDTSKTGLLALYNGAALVLGGAVGSSQTVGFFGGSDSLSLGNAATFAGTLSGLGATDIIDFLKQDIVSASTTGDTLAVGVAGGETIDLALAAPLSGLSLTLQSDGSGGTDLLFSTAPTH